MRAKEFVAESASSGSTSAGNVATVVKPLKKKDDLTFFGGDQDDFPKYGDASVVVIRRNNKTD